MTTDLTSAAQEVYPDIKMPVNGEPRDASVLASLLGQPLTNALLWLRRRGEEIYGSFLPLGGLLPVAASVAGNTFTIAGHGLSANDPFRVLSVGGSVPSPLVAGTTYYAGSVTSNTFTALSSSGGSVVTLTNTGSGTIYVAKRGVASFYQLTTDGLVTLGNALTVAGAFVANGASVFNSSITQSGGGVTLGGDTVIGGYLNPQKAVAFGSQSISPTATTVTVTAAKSVWYVDTPNPAGGVLAITVDSSGVIPPADAEILIVAWNLQTHGAQVIPTPDGATPLTTMQTDKAASTRLKFVSSKWRVIGTTGASTTISNAYV